MKKKRKKKKKKKKERKWWKECTKITSTRREVFVTVDSNLGQAWAQAAI